MVDFAKTQFGDIIAFGPRARKMPHFLPWKKQGLDYLAVLAASLVGTMRTWVRDGEATQGASQPYLGWAVAVPVPAIVPHQPSSQV